MSVSALVVMPTQPATTPSSNVLKFEPLGGNGYRSPFAAYSVRVGVLGDASGGFAQVRIGFDERYVALLSYVHIGIIGAVADTDFICNFQCGIDDNVQLTETALKRGITSVSGYDTNYIWLPPACVASGPPNAGTNTSVAPYVDTYVDNVDGDTLTVGLRVYLFQKDARERVPLEQLLAVLKR